MPVHAFIDESGRDQRYLLCVTLVALLSSRPRGERWPRYCYPVRESYISRKKKNLVAGN